MAMASLKRARLALFLTAALAGAATASAQAVKAIPVFDLQKVIGSWYQVAAYPLKPDRHCISDALVLYALGDKPNQFQLVNTCRMKDANTAARNANGKLDKTNGGQLKIRYVWPFTEKYWILASGQENEWLLIGSPNHKTLWILSRTPTLPDETMSSIKAAAASQGFNPAKLTSLPNQPSSPTTNAGQQAPGQ